MQFYTLKCFQTVRKRFAIILTEYPWILAKIRVFAPGGPKNIVQGNTYGEFPSSILILYVCACNFIPINAFKLKTRALL